MNITIPNQMYSENKMLKIWNSYWSKNNKEYLKKPRRERPTVKTPLSTENPMYFMAFDGEIPVGYCGIEDNGSFFASAGVYVVPEYQGKKISSNLMKKRLDKVDSANKPIIAFINNKNLPEGTWYNAWKRKGWKKADLENLPENLPANIVKKEIEAYGQDYVLIYSKDNISKAWFNILKRHR